MNDAFDPNEPGPADAPFAPAERPSLAELAGEAGGGLVCRECGCRHFLVKGTWRLKDGTIRRLRICRHCGRPITTSERPDEKEE